MQAIRQIVIVGGGTAGWLTAGTLAARHHTGADNCVKVTLIESPNVPIIGVGEGTWPTMRNTLQKMGISETEFFRQCHASFKQGAKFAKWTTGEEDDAYYHPLVLPQGFVHTNLAPHWLNAKSGVPFSSSVCAQDFLCDNHLAPKQISTPEFAAVENYAYHLDAGKFSQFLQKHCVEKLGVNHILDDVTGVNAHDNGDIKSLNTQNSGELSGDLFIDCSGFRSLLLGEHYQVPFVDCKDILFIDKALAVQVPYSSDNAPIASHTISTAQDAGWIWDIGLQNRKGVGHVYSSAHTGRDKAEVQLRNYIRQSYADADALTVREIDIHAGHRACFWKNNCVAVGLAAGFLEPLEASALVLVELAADMIADQLPENRQTMDIIAKRYNEKFLYRWDRIIDFLKLHYCISKRDDSAFWRDNRDPAGIPDSLKELLELWTYQSPWHGDFVQKDEVFPAASYQYVLYGMGFKTQVAPRFMSEMAMSRAQQQFEQNRQRIDTLSKAMPSNRELINKIHQFGLQQL